MTLSPEHVLIVEDMPALAESVGAVLAYASYQHSTAETGAAALDKIERTLPDVVLLDLMLPDMNGMDVLRQVTDRRLPCAVVIMTAHGSIPTVVEAMNLGAYDFIAKPFSSERLLTTVRNAMEHQRLTRAVQSLRAAMGEGRFHGFIGSSPAMQAVYRIIDSAAASKATVCITGEPGTGKSVCAEAIHRQSQRREGPFVTLNCGAVPDDQMEADLFGHGGAAEQADGGTLFIDNVSDLRTPDLQAKLLRFLQTGQYRQDGRGGGHPLDVRLVCSTSRDLLEEVQSARLREDLYYRLHVLPIVLPPLRDRENDAVEIANHFVARISAEEGRRFVRLSDAAAQIVHAYSWPGNVHELQNVVRQAVVLHDGQFVTPAMLPAPLVAVARDNMPALPPTPADAVSAGGGPPIDDGASSPADDIIPLALLERAAIERAIELCGGHVPTAALRLGIAPATIYRRKAQWAIDDALPGADRTQGQ